MLDLLFVALMQAASGDPAPTAPSAQAPAAASSVDPSISTATTAPATQPAPGHAALHCVYEDSDTGSHMGRRRVCRTAAQEQEARDHAVRETERLQREMTEMPAPGH